MEKLDNKVIGLARRVRELAEKYAFDCGDFDEDLGGMCAVASRALCNVLRRHGYKPKFVHIGDGWHCWVESDGWVVDITATQFNNGLWNLFFPPRYPKVHIISVKDKDKDDTYSLHDRSLARDVDHWGTNSPVQHKDWINMVVDRLAPKG